MRKDIVTLMRELERRDAEERRLGVPTEERGRNLKPDAGAFLNLLVKATRPRLTVEVGTSNGYSTLWLAEAAQAVGGRIVTLELRPRSHAEAVANLAQVGLGDVVEARLGDAHALIPDVKGPFDLAFLDAEKDDYIALAEKLIAKLRVGSLLVADNVTSHSELKAYLDTVNANPALLTAVVPVGQGEAVTVKLDQPLPAAFLQTLAEQEARAKSSSTMNQVPREAGALLNILVRATGARQILEVGMSGGYSTMWLAQAARATKGRVTTVERDSAKVNIARKNFAASGLAEVIEVQTGEAERHLPRLAGPFDLVFLDADKEAQVDYLELLLPRISPGGLIVSDNHLTHPADMADYTAYVRSLPGLESLLLPVGNGMEMTWKVDSRRRKGA